MFTANSPKRRKALRRFGDRARSTGVNVHSQFPEAPQGLAAVRRSREIGEKGGGEGGGDGDGD